MVRLIKEFANSRNDEIRKLKDVREILREHLMCIYYWRDTDCKNHWEGEIFSFLPIMSKLKMNHKYLSKKLIYENLFTDFAETFYMDIHTYVEKLMYKEKGLPTIYDLDEKNLYKFLDDFYTEISDILADIGSVRKDVVYKIIEKLLKKYPYEI